MLVNVPTFLLAACLAGYGSVRYLREDRRQELLAFISLMAGIGLWQLANVLRDLSTTPSTKLQVLHVFLAVVVPVFGYSLLWFALAYTDSSQRRIRAVGGLFVAEVLVVGGGIALDPGFLQSVDGVVYQGPVTVLNVTFERWVVLDRTFKTAASIHQLYHYAVWIVSGAILVRHSLGQRSEVAVGQVAATVVGIGTTLIVSSLLFFGVLPPELALTDVALGVLALCLAIAVFRYRLLDLTLVGRRQFVENMDDPLVFVNDEDEVVHSNPPARQVFDVEAGWKGMDATEFFGPYAEAIRPSGTGDPPRDETVEVDDANRYYDVNSTTIETPTGERRGRTIALREVTDLKLTNRRLDQFASMVSHDLRTPLNAAVVRTDRIARERSDEDAEAVRESLDRMEAMIDDMLRLARAGGDVEATEECHLLELVEEVWATVEADGAELDCRLGETTVEADPVRLFQVLENLLRNAVEHNDSPLTVRVGTFGDGGGPETGEDAVGFFVEDDGRGLAADHREGIFEHGYTTDPDGNGYGLSIVRYVVEAHDWEIRVTDGRSGGTRFEVTTAGDR
jgi:signal transduction histidine kinase